MNASGPEQHGETGTAPQQIGTSRLSEAFASSLHDLFGERVLFSDAVRQAHGRSETHIPEAAPDAVAFARTTEEVVALIRLCRADKVPVVPYGAGTSLEGHTVAPWGGVCLNLSEMDQILEVNATDFDCTVQPGVTREQLNEHLRDQGLFFPIDPGANATLGGMASTRASGTNAVRYGTMRDAVMALRVVLPDGSEMRTGRRARKSAAGYDLTRLLVGAEGTLGVITEITLRLHPIPETISAAVCSFKTLDGAVDTVVQAMQMALPMARIELLDEVQMRAINRHAHMSHPEAATLFFEFHGSALQVPEQVEMLTMFAGQNGGGDLTWAVTVEDRNRLWKARHQAYYAALQLRPGCVGWPTDVCVPISRLAECIRDTKADIVRAGLVAPILGHVGDGNFHVVFVVDPNNSAELEQVEHLNARLIERALNMDGTCTGEHGIGLGKQDWLEQELGGAVDVMRSIKAALDPDNLLNPGKVFRTKPTLKPGFSVQPAEL